MNSTYLVATTVTQENILETCTNSTQNHRLGQRLKLKDLAQVQDGDNAAVWLAQKLSYLVARGEI